MPLDPEQRAHQEWIGYVQPVGLVVSAPALLAAQAHVNRNIAPEHQRFMGCLPRDRRDEPIPEIRDFPEFTENVLGWEPGDLVALPEGPLPDDLADLEVALPLYHETLRPTWAVPRFKPREGEGRWLMLVQRHPAGTDFDEPTDAGDRHWHASPQAKFERLLRETEVPIGLVSNGGALRLVYAPRGETSGHMTFVVDEMLQVAGRAMFAALHMLLCAERVFGIGMADPDKHSLAGILADSRRYQNVVSTKLAEQVLAALYELLRGFQAANDQRHGELLRDVLERDPDHVYAGLLTVLMRTVFVLYAEDRGLLSADPVYANHYSVTGLFERLREDAGRHPDTMDQRYGAWAQLLTLYRLIYEGGRHGALSIPPRKGYLFDPRRFPFLEGYSTQRSEVGDQRSEVGTSDRTTKPPNDHPKPLTTHDSPLTPEIPRISDGTIYRVLRNLLILDGERLSYRTLDVEQIGSVYETIMGFHLQVAGGRSIAIKPVKSHGAPATINLEELLTCKPAGRAKWLKDESDQKVTGQALKALKEADSIDDLLAALDKKIAKKVTPRVVPKGAMVLQPSDERRRSGSHYTPRSLTEPIVRKTLEPVLAQLSAVSNQPSADVDQPSSPPHPHTPSPPRTPTPEQILALKICDPAMGSGAFLVEACRQLGDELVAAWHAHDCLPVIPPDEDEVLHARRLVAQRCLYGVDKNPLAVDLSKLSLWLATLAKDHPFTFLDHALRCGDSLVGLSKQQIAAFHWDTSKRDRLRRANFEDMEGAIIETRIQRASEYRRQILDAREDVPYLDQESRLALADESMQFVRLIGDLVVSAFFHGAKKKAREERCDDLFLGLSTWFSAGMQPDLRTPLAEAVDELRTGEHPLPPFHWEIEFPEVFDRENGGFDACVGNPPFLGGSNISGSFGDSYKDWLTTSHVESHGNSDLVAHFFRRCFVLLRESGAEGLIATNTIGQGDTRTTGLRWICTNGGRIYAVQRRLKWPGAAAVIVSVIHLARDPCHVPVPTIDGRPAPTITAHLFHAGGHENPYRLHENAGTAFLGAKVYGQGFLFDESLDDAEAGSTGEMEELVRKNPRNAERIFPYLGGEEVNDSPTHRFRRHVISFDQLSEEEASEWPDLLQIVEERVKPERMKLRNNADGRRRKQYWWLWGRYPKALFSAIAPLSNVLVNSQVSPHLSFARLPSTWVFSHALNVFAIESSSMFCAIQSRPHEVWARHFASTMKDDLRYTPSDCFDTFPFPLGVLEMARGCASEVYETFSPDVRAYLGRLEQAGREYYEFRADLMVRNDEGLTKTYNRFHDPYEESADIQRLRELHAAMDRAVLARISH